MNLRLILGAGLVMTSVLSISAQKQEEPKYMRSSIYTVLVNSDRQNKELDKEITERDNAITKGIKDIVGTEKKRALNDSLGIPKSQMLQIAFSSIPIPEQFNDHNLAERIIDYDAIVSRISKEDAKKYNESVGIKTESKGIRFIKEIGGGILSHATGKNESSIIKVDTINEYIPAVVNAYITENNIAAKMLGKWFNYDASQTPKWNFGTIVDRGLYNASAEDLSKAASSDFLRAALVGKGFELLNNTFLIAINLKLDNVQDKTNEIIDIAFSNNDVVETITDIGFGDSYYIAASAYLYKLEWNDSISTRFAEQFYNKDATIEDLIKSNLCKLKFVGKETARDLKRRNKFSNSPEIELIKTSTKRAIDRVICKLQEKFEVFRTTFPISDVDENGNVYAKVGMKEGIEKDDKYQILEMIENENGRIEYKEIRKVKAVESQIWDNCAGVAEEVEFKKQSQKDGEAAEQERAASLGYTMFKGGKKGEDYSGYFLRLKDKK